MATNPAQFTPDPAAVAAKEAADKAAADKAAADKPSAPKEVKKLSLRAVYGDLHHPYTHMRFVTDASKRHEIDGWVKVQMDAGKLAVASEE